MRRLHLIIALGATGLLLALTHHACSPEPGQVTAAHPARQQTAERQLPQDTEEKSTTGIRLPVDPQSLRAAADVVRQFLTLYSTYATRNQLADRSTKLAQITTSAARGILTSAERTADNAVTRGQTATAACRTPLGIRLLAPSSIQFLATIDQQVTSPRATNRVEAIYAVTVVRDGTWKVDSLSHVDAGDAGTAQP